MLLEKNYRYIILVFQDNTSKNQDFFSTHVQFQDFSGPKKWKVKFHDYSAFSTFQDQWEPWSLLPATLLPMLARDWHFHASRQSDGGNRPTSATEPLVQLDLESGTICRQTSDSWTCHPDFRAVAEEVWDPLADCSRLEAELQRRLWRLQLPRL